MSISILGDTPTQLAGVLDSLFRGRVGPAGIPSDLINPMVLIQISTSFANALICPYTDYVLVKHYAALPH